MSAVRTRAFSFLALLLVAISARAAADADRWDLSAIYPDEKSWQAALELLKTRTPEVQACHGRLGESADTLKRCLDLSFELQKLGARVNAWSELAEAADHADAKNTERSERAHDAASKLQETAAFYNPELTALGREKLEKLESKSAALAPYRQYLRTILDQAEHTLDTPREALLASLGPVLSGGRDLQQLLLTSDVSWKTVKFSDGKKLPVDETTYERYRESANRSDRALAFSAFYSVLGQYQRTLGADLANSVKRDVIEARTRSYPNALAAALDANKIPEEVYRTLIQQVNEGLPVFQSYLSLQKERLGLKKLEYVDAYAPGGGKSPAFPLAVSEKTVLDAVAPLGPDYVKKLGAAFSQRWMDVYPRKGKEGGAFMNPAAYDVHPYLLLNQQDNLTSMSTLAHEWGHAMHSLYSQAGQPYVYSDYATFIAEIASTCNEVLLHEYLIRNAKSPKEKAFYLEDLLKLIRGTFFRQAQFGEFELALHEEVEKGQALSGQRMSEIYGGIARKYYGHAKGVMEVDAKYFPEWAFVPHFYGAFYVYQYATSISAAFYFADQILSGKPGAAERYLKVLSAGSSKYPYEILLDAGVDMKSPQVYRAVVERMRSATEELRALKAK